MAGRPNAMNRQNEYFVPRDGIDREVITADICRYLGNDALVRPGTYEEKETGQLIQGYYINAYRNLTTAMIEDLKEASRQWSIERTRVSGGISPRSYGNGYASPSNPTPAYRHSETHQRQQGSGGIDQQYSSGPSYDRYNQPTQPVYNAPPPQNYPPHQQSYGQGQGNYPPYQQPPNTYSPPARADPYSAPPPQGYTPHGGHPPQEPFAHGSNRPVYVEQPGSRNVNYGGPPRAPPSSMSQQQPGFPAPPQPQQPFYPQPQGGGYIPPSQAQPMDAFPGRSASRPYNDQPGAYNNDKPPSPSNTRSKPKSNLTPVAGKDQHYGSPDPSYDEQSHRTVTPTGSAIATAPAPRNQRDPKSHPQHRHKYP